MCFYMFPYVWADVCGCGGGPQMMMGVFLSCSPLYILRQTLGKWGVSHGIYIMHPVEMLKY